MAAAAAANSPNGAARDAPKKLHGRTFYESIGSPKFIIAPMVDQSEFAWRMLSRSYMAPDEQSSLLAYTPMLHARHFATDDKYRKIHFSAQRADSSEPWLDGNPSLDRPLFVQFCANDPDALLAAAKHVAPHCDAVDLNLGCPQGIARKGHYGAFLQEEQDLIFRLINTLHKELSVPVTAKIRILETKEKTLAYAKNVLSAGASILTVHGRRREQKGHQTGVADWKMIRFLRDSLPPETVLFANGNILQGGDVQSCLEATGADGIMSAEGHLSDPAIFARIPTADEEDREYWRGKDGKGGWRVDAMMRRYMDILHKYVWDAEPPQRRPLFVIGDDTDWLSSTNEESNTKDDAQESKEPPTKKRKKDVNSSQPAANMSAIQPHLFHLLRHLVSKHTDVRDMLARTRKDNLEGYEKVLAAVERKVAEGILEYERTGGESFEAELAKIGGGADTNNANTTATATANNGDEKADGKGEEEKSEAIQNGESSVGTIRKCKRPWWVAQPIIRPLPSEALAKGALTMSKKDKAKQQGTGAEVAKKDEAATEQVAEAQAQAQDSGKEEELKSRDALVAG